MGVIVSFTGKVTSLDVSDDAILIGVCAWSSYPGPCYYLWTGSYKVVCICASNYVIYQLLTCSYAPDVMSDDKDCSARVITLSVSPLLLSMDTISLCAPNVMYCFPVLSIYDNTEISQHS